VVGFKDGKIAYEHIYWDQASLLVQIGLLDQSKLPVTGAEPGGACSIRAFRPTRSSPRADSVQAFGFFCREARLFDGFGAEGVLCSTCRGDWGAGAGLRILKKVHQPWNATPAPQPRATQ